MTLEQAKRLKEMGFPQYCEQYIYDPVNEKSEHYANPTAEEAHNWIYQKIRGKYDLIITNNCIIELNDGEITIEIGRYKTLSEAVYALIVWAYENKLLEGK